MKKTTPSSETQSEANFEQALTRLEKILELMNNSAIGLDESLKLYEEADGLIGLCTKRLNDAERKIEMLIKNREGNLELDAQGYPKKKIMSIDNE